MEIIQPNLKFKWPLKMTNKPEMVVVHHALAPKCSINDIHSWHLDNGWTGCGYHLFITRSGKVYQGRPFKAKGAHVKEDGINYKSIGVCLEGCYTDYKGLAQKEVPKKQLHSLIEVCNYLQDEFEMGSDFVKLHRDFANYKDCPGKYFPEKEFYSSLNHWADTSFNNLINKGITIHEKRYKSNISRAEYFVMEDRITSHYEAIISKLENRIQELENKINK